MARRRLTTVPGSDPVSPAAHVRASTVHTGYPVATAPELKRAIWRRPNRRYVRSWNSLATRSCRAYDFTPHPGPQNCSTHNNDLALRPSGVRAGPESDSLAGRVAPSSRSKLALFL